MCHWCQQHGDRDHRWYEKIENYMFTKEDLVTGYFMRMVDSDLGAIL